MEQQVANVIQLLEREQPWEEAELRKALEQFTSKTLRATCYHLQLRVIKTGLNKTDYKGGYVDLLVAHRHAKFASAADAIDECGGDHGAHGNSSDAGSHSHALAAADSASQGLSGAGVSPHGAGATVGLYNNWKRRTKGCALRLLNVLFSDYFQARLEDLNRRGCRLSDDSFEMAQFWSDVAAEFASNRDEYGVMQSEHECFRDIDLALAIKHDARKLQLMWKEIMAKFMIAWKSAEKLREEVTRAAVTAAAASGSPATSSGDLSSPTALSMATEFLAHCGHRADVFYVYVWLMKKPHLQAVLKLNVGARPRPNLLPRQDALPPTQINTDDAAHVVVPSSDSAPLQPTPLFGAVTPQWTPRVDVQELPEQDGSTSEDVGVFENKPFVEDLNGVGLECDREPATNGHARLKRARLSPSGTATPTSNSNLATLELMQRQRELIQLQIDNERARRLEEQYDRAVSVVSCLLKTRAEGLKNGYDDAVMQEIERDLEYNLEWKRKSKAELEQLHVGSGSS